MEDPAAGGIERRDLDLGSIKAAQEEIRQLVKEIESNPLIPEQVRSRRARLAVLQKQVTEAEADSQTAGEIERIKRLSQEFNPITLPNAWHIGYVEEIKPSRFFRIRQIIRLRHSKIKRPHSVFKGIIPVWVLNRYKRAKDRGIFDDIVVAAPRSEAFTQLGVRIDPVLVGVISKVGRVSFGFDGRATVASAGLNEEEYSCLFEIARWDTAEDLEGIL